MTNQINSRISELRHELRLLEIEIDDFNARIKDCTDLENKAILEENLLKTLSKIISKLEVIIELEKISLQ